MLLHPSQQPGAPHSPALQPHRPTAPAVQPTFARPKRQRHHKLVHVPQDGSLGGISQAGALPSGAAQLRVAARQPCVQQNQKRLSCVGLHFHAARQ